MQELQPTDEERDDFAEKVSQILDSTLPPGSANQPTDAANSLNTLFRERELSAEDFLWRFWNLFHNLSRQLPHDGPENERLAAIVKALYDLEPESVHLDNWGGDAQVWRQLPLFGPILNDIWDCTCVS
jgi:hypothetical protein